MRSFRYTNSKGARISLGANSIPSTLEDGVVGCWPMENISEYPTGAATYFQDAWATTDGHTTFNSSLSVANGRLIITSTAISPTVMAIKTTGAFTGKTLKLKVYNPNNYTMRYFNASGAAYANMTKIADLGGGFQIWQAEGVNSDGSDRVLYGFNASAIGQSVEVDFTYLGDGSYAANSLLDNSGNGNHGQILGCTPVDGVSGKGLLGDGVDDYTSLPTTAFQFQQKTISFWLNTIATSGVAISYLNSLSYFGWRTEVAASKLRLQYRGTGGVLLAQLDSTSLVNTGAWKHCAFTDDGSVIRCFVDGVQESTVASVANVWDSATVFGLFARSIGGTIAGLLAGTIDEPRIYNRALSAAEVNALYRFRAAPFVATGETAYGIIESVEGIDSADADIQATRAPLQDGQTYIDSLFDSREVVVRGSIMVPKNLDTIYARRKIILDALNPKYGNGTLDFFYGANTINHRVLQNVVVEKVQFPNKPFQNPFQEFQITFRANDPYFYDPLTDTHGIQILSGESRTFTVGGEQDTPVAIRIYGAATNPSATNSTVGETIALTYSLAGGSYIDIDTRFGSKTIKLNGATSLIGNLDIGSSFWNLRVGSNTVSYTGGGYVILLWRERYIGV